MRGVVLVLGIAGLGCGGLPLFPEADLVDVDAERAAAAGFAVPDGASSISVRDRGTLDVRTTWFRYALPPEGLAALRDELEGDAGVTGVGAWQVPDDWPEFDGLGFEAPDWWAPSGDTYRRELPGAGRQWALGSDEVHVWMWSREI